MSKPAKISIINNLTAADYGKLRKEIKEAQDAADDASTVVASAYKKLKKAGHHIDALKLVNKLKALDNAAKSQAFLAAFDKYRQIAGLDSQQALFEEDKTAPQKKAEKAAKAEKPAKAAKPAKAGRPAKAAKVNGGAKPNGNGRVARKNALVPTPAEVAPKGKGGRKALFAESDDEDDRPVH